MHFNLLHAKDSGRVHYQRVCDTCGKKLEWNDVVKGYPIQKDDYVVVTDQDLKKAYPEATQSVDIVAFAGEAEINPMLFDTPYYLEPEKRGRRAYSLLREALKDSGRVGIARVVIRTKEHLAALRPQGDALVLELMHWADEVVAPDDLELPTGKQDAVRAPEMKAAKMLIDSMTTKFDPKEYKDHTREKLMELVEAKSEGRAIPKSKGGAPAATNVVDLAEMLQRSLSGAKDDKRDKRDKASDKSAAKRTARTRSASPRRRAASGRARKSGRGKAA